MRTHKELKRKEKRPLRERFPKIMSARSRLHVVANATSENRDEY